MAERAPNTTGLPSHARNSLHFPTPLQPTFVRVWSCPLSETSSQDTVSHLLHLDALNAGPNKLVRRAVSVDEGQTGGPATAPDQLLELDCFGPPLELT